MRIGEVARRAGVNVETLRYYERRGLLPAPDRDPSGHRRYDERDVEMLDEVVRARAEGRSLETAIDLARRLGPRVELSLFAAVRRADPYLLPVTLPKRADRRGRSYRIDVRTDGSQPA